jgi:hypothetical protein
VGWSQINPKKSEVILLISTPRTHFKDNGWISMPDC